jgi:uncharacterized membrane protein
MTADNPAPTAALAEEPPIFSTVLAPYRSLSPRGFLILMAAFGALSFTAGSIFWAIGAWPVIGFMGLDIALVYLAFRLNYRAGRVCELIEVTRETLTVRKVDADGRAAEARFNPYWARLLVDRKPELGIIRMSITSHGKRLDIGEFLPLPQREPLARALAGALAEARATPGL